MSNKGLIYYYTMSGCRIAYSLYQQTVVFEYIFVSAASFNGNTSKLHFTRKWENYCSWTSFSWFRYSKNAFLKNIFHLSGVINSFTLVLIVLIGMWLTWHVSRNCNMSIWFCKHHMTVNERHEKFPRSHLKGTRSLLEIIWTAREVCQKALDTYHSDSCWWQSHSIMTRNATIYIQNVVQIVIVSLEAFNCVCTLHYLALKGTNHPLQW